MKILPVILLLSVLLFSCTETEQPLLEEEILEIDLEEEIDEEEIFEEEEIEIIPVIWQNGDGSLQNPFQIETAGNLFYLSQQVNDTLKETPNDYYYKYFRVVNDINLASKPFQSIGGLKNNYEFKGHLDGNNKIISNLYINTPNARYTGLFGKTNANTTFKNIILSNVSIIGGDKDTGGIVGNSHSPLIDNCKVEGTITGGRYVGGIIGYANTGETRIISNCMFEGNIVGTENVGGIAGYTRAGYMNYCTSKGSIAGDYRIGGLSGDAFHFEMNNSSSVAVVQGNLVTGGLVGEIITGNIKDSFFEGSVEGTKMSGGISGKTSSSSSIVNSYNVGTIEGTEYIGGLVGSMNDTSIQKSFNSGDIIGSSIVGGIAAFVATSTDQSHVKHCYNSGKLSGGVRVAGIAGLVDRGRVSYCYNLGELPDIQDSSKVDQIATYSFISDELDENNTYYLGNANGTKQKTSEYMKSIDFLNGLNNLDSFWKMDGTPNQNNGYPIHVWR
tara:strand:+ start:595 stop:2094 length:1500 start_codon:yes stop_codon:yes gene_type:complete